MFTKELNIFEYTSLTKPSLTYIDLVMLLSVLIVLFEINVWQNASFSSYFCKPSKTQAYSKEHESFIIVWLSSFDLNFKFPKCKIPETTLSKLPI